MSRILLIIGGVLNILLAAFHVFLGYQIYQIQNIAIFYRALMTMLNVGGTLFIVLFAVASLALTQEMLTTRLGKLVMVFVVLLYASRAFEEIVIAPYYSVYIFGICILMSAIYFVLLVMGRNNQLLVNEEKRN